MADDRPLAGLRVLVIEDAYVVAADLKRILERGGAGRVILSGSAADALERIREDGFEVALLDPDLRGESTLPIADRLVDHRVPFAFMSGYDRTAIPPRFAAVPNWGKPYDDERVVKDVRRLRKRPDPA